MLTELIQAATIIAVSYTHLDVYKRQVQKCKELPACVVENSVNHHFDVRFMTQGDKVLKAFIVTQTAVHRAVVPCVIPV